jgi:hypothetical protein
MESSCMLPSSKVVDSKQMRVTCYSSPSEKQISSLVGRIVPVLLMHYGSISKEVDTYIR